jgi:hypothetical protein
MPKLKGTAKDILGNIKSQINLRRKTTKAARTLNREIGPESVQGKKNLAINLKAIRKSLRAGKPKQARERVQDQKRKIAN